MPDDETPDELADDTAAINPTEQVAVPLNVQACAQQFVLEAGEASADGEVIEMAYLRIQSPMTTAMLALDESSGISLADALYARFGRGPKVEPAIEVARDMPRGLRRIE